MRESVVSTIHDGGTLEEVTTRTPRGLKRIGEVLMKMVTLWIDGDIYFPIKMETLWIDGDIYCIHGDDIME